MVDPRRADPQFLTTQRRQKFAASSNIPKTIAFFFSTSTTALILIRKLAAPHQPSKNGVYLDRYRRWKLFFCKNCGQLYNTSTP